MNTKVKQITPRIAANMLNGNGHNRKLSAITTHRLAQSLQRGEWKLNGAPIIVGKSGRLLDGQHRLQAVIESGETIETLVVEGVQEDAFNTIDLGRKRTNGDALYINGEEHANILAASLKIINSYYLNKFSQITGGSSALTPTQTEALLKAHPRLRDSVVYAMSHRKDMKGMLALSYVAATHYILTRLDQTKGHNFMEKIRTGANLDVDSPILILRRSLLNYSNKYMRPKLILLIKAWNAEVQGRTYKVLRVGDNEKPAEFLKPTL